MYYNESNSEHPACKVSVAHAGRSERLEGATDTMEFWSRGVQNSTRARKFRVDAVHAGRSMIEMLGVLAIIGVLSVGGIAGYSKAMMKFKINKTIDQISHIAANIRTLYAQQKDYRGLNNRTAILLGALPVELGTIPWSLTNAFGGTIDIASDDSDYFYEHYRRRDFGIAFNGLPKEACVEIATQNWGSITTTGLRSVGVRGHAITAGEYAYGDYSPYRGGPMSVNVAAQYCDCGNENTCAVAIHFH